jgi:hypothetical protein
LTDAVAGFTRYCVADFSYDAGSDSLYDGDMNQDTKVSAVDALLALRIAVGLDAMTGAMLGHGDMNRDGKISAVDALLILRKAVGLVDKATVARSSTPAGHR